MGGSHASTPPPNPNENPKTPPPNSNPQPNTGTTGGPIAPFSGAWTQGPNGSWTWTPGATPNPSLVGVYGSSALTNITRNPSGQLNSGSWYEAPTSWKWVPGATPDPDLVGLYGSAMTNPDENPSAGRDSGAHATGPGAWVPTGLEGQWQWAWGMGPDPNLAPKGTTTAQLTDPNTSPNGKMGPGNPNSPDYPADSYPDVVPPTLKDIWPFAPNIIVNEEGGSGQQVSSPPDHQPYLVSPGSIRDAENTLLGPLGNTYIPDYNSLKAYVAETPSQNLYSAGMTQADLQDAQDHLLQNIADVIELVGQFTGMLNNAAQNYAQADTSSFMPTT